MDGTSGAALAAALTVFIGSLMAAEPHFSLLLRKSRRPVAGPKPAKEAFEGSRACHILPKLRLGSTTR